MVCKYFTCLKFSYPTFLTILTLKTFYLAFSSLSSAALRVKTSIFCHVNSLYNFIVTSHKLAQLYAAGEINYMYQNIQFCPENTQNILWHILVKSFEKCQALIVTTQCSLNSSHVIILRAKLGPRRLFSKQSEHRLAIKSARSQKSYFFGKFKASNNRETNYTRLCIDWRLVSTLFLRGLLTSSADFCQT